MSVIAPAALQQTAYIPQPPGSARVAAGGDGWFPSQPYSGMLVSPIDDLPGNVVNSIIHLHRAEISTMTAYRIRMDTSTNWAVSMISALTVFALNNANVPHPFFLILLFLNTVFLVIESRRFSLFAFSRNRVLVIERGFFGRSLLRDVSTGTEVDTADTMAMMKSPAHAALTRDLRLIGEVRR